MVAQRRFEYSRGGALEMTRAELRRQMHLQEVEKKIKLLQMNWFIKNHSEEADDDGPRPTAPSSVHMTRLVDEIREMRAEIRYINAKLDEYQREINDKRTADKPGRPSPPLLETNVSYMYRVPSDVKLQLYTGISSNDEGRLRYLKTRSKLSPDEKFRVCPTQNYKYGWDIKKHVIGAPLQKYGRQQTLKRAMYSIHGVTLYEKHPTQRPPNSVGQWSLAKY